MPALTLQEAGLSLRLQAESRDTKLLYNKLPIGRGLLGCADYPSGASNLPSSRKSLEGRAEKPPQHGPQHFFPTNLREHMQSAYCNAGNSSSKQQFLIRFNLANNQP